MRMWHYFAAAALLLVPALLATLGTGILHDESERHLWTGLFTATLGVAVHTLVILFMLITGRILREAMRARSLGPEWLAELNRFFAERRAYPLSVLGAFSLVAAGVLGMSARGFDISPVWHMLVGVSAIFANIWALGEEYKALRANQRLVDRVAHELDRIDGDARSRGEVPPGEASPDPPGDPRAVARFGLTLMIGAWLPYLYWALITWRGDFSRVSLHPWVEGSLVGLVLWWFGRASTPSPSGSEEGP
jgi:hypothetical protein